MRHYTEICRIICKVEFRIPCSGFLEQLVLFFIYRGMWSIFFLFVVLFMRVVIFGLRINERK